MRTLIVKDYGVVLRYRKGLIVVEKGRQVLHKIPVSAVDQILLLTSGIMLSTKLIRVLARNSIDLVVLNHRGEPCARLDPPYTTRTILTKREQYKAYHDERGATLAKNFVLGKLYNQAGLLNYYARNRSNPHLKDFLKQSATQIEQIAFKVKLLQGRNVDEIRDTLMRLEAEAAHAYWQGVVRLLPPELEFYGRNQKGDDIFNKMLNYGYGVLKNPIWRALILAGLDPYAGFLHADRSGRPSLMLDLIEEFRQPAVDRVLIALANKKGAQLKEMIEPDGRLNNELRGLIAAEITKRLASKVRYKNEKIPLERVIMRQARLIAKHLRKEEPYKPYIERW